MKPIVIDIPHSLGAAEARQRLEQGFEKLLGQMGENARISREWAGDRMTFSAAAMGQTISGHLEVAAETVRLEINLPNVLAMLAGQIRGRVRKQGQLLLGDRARPNP